ncbi:hypothetical protein ARMGADRAFT_973692 [Armillaria gallica]|uniref:CBM1 domain-containing protein n=1 Tax=Armillaria gallica TaxID=47427 RepID=A0A2H3D3S6_ARMGA|nr:hypothetical protein ARMGADRAFT_973692 [Armillaria gallica]
MIFQIKVTAMALAAVLLFAGHANALAPNPVDACNGSNNYGVGHSCAYSTSEGTAQGTCQNDSDGVLICVPN